MGLKITFLKNNWSHYLNDISPISVEQKQINISAKYVFFVLLFTLLFLKPIFFSFVSFQSLIEITFLSVIIFIGIGWLYFSYTAKKINVKTWTYYNDIVRFLKGLLLILLVYFCYVFLVLNYLYKEELKLNGWDFDRNVFLELIPYILFIGFFVYVLIKFIDHIKFANHAEFVDDNEWVEENELASSYRNVKKDDEITPIHTIRKSRFHFLNLIVPISIEQNEIIVSAIIEFVFTFIIQITFRPGFLGALSISTLFKITFVTSLIFAVTRGVFYYWSVKKINIKSWTYKKDIIRFYKVLGVATVIYYVYTYLIFNYWNRTELIQNYWDVNMNIFFPRLYYIFFIGTTAYLISKFLDFTVFSNQIIQKNHQTENNFAFLTEKRITNKGVITLYGKNKNEKIIVNIEDFIYLESFGHYIKVFVKINEFDVKNLIIRNSIQNVLDFLLPHNDIFQCHRSYIVNLKYVEEIEGNSKKASIKINNTTIPLSRELYNDLKRKLENEFDKMSSA